MPRSTGAARSNRGAALRLLAALALVSVLVGLSASDPETLALLRRPRNLSTHPIRRVTSPAHHLPTDIVDAISSTKDGPVETRQRRPHNQLKDAMRVYLTTLNGGHASIAEIKAAVEPKVGIAPASSYRSALQDERYFERVARGVFRLRD